MPKPKWAQEIFGKWKPQGIELSPERDLMEKEQTRVMISKAGVLWEFWSEAEGWPTGDGAVELEVEVMRDGSWGWVMAN